MISISRRHGGRASTKTPLSEEGHTLSIIGASGSGRGKGRLLGSLALGGGFALALLTGALPAQAAGYGLKEHSARAQGNALAGATAGAEDASYTVYNPAALARQSGHQLSAVASYIRPGLDLRGVTSNTGGGTGTSDAASSVVLPAVYAAFSVDDDLKLGLSINAPWGLETSYDDGWAGRYYALETRLETLTITPMVAYNVTDAFQVGGGVFAQQAKGKLSNAVNLAAFGAPGAPDGFAAVKGDDWSWGFQLGALYEPIEGTRLGLAYRSRVSHTLTGDATFEGVPLPDALLPNRFATDLTTPEVVSFGIHQELTPRWAVMAEAQWTRWSRFQELYVDFDNNTVIPDDITGKSWRNTWFAALGATYRPNDRWTLRAGVAYDQTPTNVGTRSPRIPDSDRQWVSLGVGYEPLDWLSLDFAYTHLWLRDAAIDQNDGQRGNAARGDFSATTRSTADVVAFQATARF